MPKSSAPSQTTCFHENYTEITTYFYRFDSKHMPICRNGSRLKKNMEIKGSIIVEKVDTCEEVVVPRVQGTIHPFSLSAIKSQASLSLSAALSQYTYFPWFIVSAFIDLSITRALKQISMARFFHPAGMWLTGHKNTTVLQPRRRGHESASVGSRSTSSVTTIEPLFASRLYCFAMLQFFWGISSVPLDVNA